MSMRDSTLLRKLITRLFGNDTLMPDARNHPAPPDYIYCSEVDDGRRIAGHIFRRKYGQEGPDIPRHFVAFYRSAEGQLTPVTYLHLMPYDGLYLVGGACTDGHAFREMHDIHRQELAATHGVFYFLLRHAFDKLTEECEAFFGYCGDARALEVDLLAGFEETDRKYILIHAPKGLSAPRRMELLDKIEGLGPF